MQSSNFVTYAVTKQSVSAEPYPHTLLGCFDAKITEGFWQLWQKLKSAKDNLKQL
jgi:hypothetical protein